MDREEGGGVGDIRREGEREQERDGEMCACYLTYDCSDLNNGSSVAQDDHTERVHLSGSNRQLPHLYPTCCVCVRARACVRACVRVESTCLCVFALCRRNWAPCDCCGGFCAPVSSFCCNKSTSTQCVFVRRFARAHLCWSACVQLGSTTVALLHNGQQLIARSRVPLKFAVGDLARTRDWRNQKRAGNVEAGVVAGSGSGNSISSLLDGVRASLQRQRVR